MSQSVPIIDKYRPAHHVTWCVRGTISSSPYSCLQACYASRVPGSLQSPFLCVFKGMVFRWFSIANQQDHQGSPGITRDHQGSPRITKDHQGSQASRALTIQLWFPYKETIWDGSVSGLQRPGIWNRGTPGAGRQHRVALGGLVQADRWE